MLNDKKKVNKVLNKEKYKDELEKVLSESLAVSKSGEMCRCIEIACGKCIFYGGGDDKCTEKSTAWLNSEYKDITMLTEEEKAYITEVIKPFRDKVTGILKGDNGSEFIRISVENDGAFRLPYFKKGSMYKNMKTNKKYKLEELGL